MLLECVPNRVRLMRHSCWPVPLDSLTPKAFERKLLNFALFLLFMAEMCRMEPSRYVSETNIFFVREMFPLRRLKRCFIFNVTFRSLLPKREPVKRGESAL